MTDLKETPEFLWATISTGGCFGECPIFSMRVTKTGYAKMEDSLLFNPQPRFEISKTKIKPKEFNRLLFIIKNAKLLTYKNDPTFSVTCVPIYKLKVKFKGHKVFYLEESVEEAGKKVGAIFKFFLKLRLSQDWVKTHVSFNEIEGLISQWPIKHHNIS